MLVLLALLQQQPQLEQLVQLQMLAQRVLQPMLDLLVLL
jgi:hypothetical protein